MVALENERAFRLVFWKNFQNIYDFMHTHVNVVIVYNIFL
jgi:hypothetical protein